MTFDYDAWKCDPNNYCNRPSFNEMGYIHESELPDLEHCKDFLQGLLEAVYVTGDIEKLEDCLDELCGQFSIKMPTQTPRLVKSDEFSKKLFAFGLAISQGAAVELKYKGMKHV